MHNVIAMVCIMATHLASDWAAKCVRCICQVSRAAAEVQRWWYALLLLYGWLARALSPGHPSQV